MSLEERTTSSTGGQKGVKLERFDLIPVGPLTELATHFGRGATKYDVHQWRVGYEWSKSYSAIQRHSNAFWAGFDYDVCENDPGGCAYLVLGALGEDPVTLALNSKEVTRIIDSDGLTTVIRHSGRTYRLVSPIGDVEQGLTCYNHTGSHHMVAVAWHSFVLLEFKDTHPDHDDRYTSREIKGDGADVADAEGAPDDLLSEPPNDYVVNGQEWVHYCPERTTVEPIRWQIQPYFRCELCGTDAPKIEIGPKEGIGYA